MQKLYLISQCLGFRKNIAIFHFKGFYKGQKIKEIHLFNGENFILDEKYLIEIQAISIIDQKILGRAKRSKKLFN